MYENRSFKMKNQGVLLFKSLTSLFLIAFMLSPLIGNSQRVTWTGKKATWIVPHTLDFNITGDTLSTAWRAAPWILLPQRDVSIESKHTRAKLLYSDSGIYCLFWCEDTLTTASLKKDFTDLYNEDVVEAFFWPDEKYPLYFEYELSPLNYELAILVPNMQGNFFGWRPWHYETNRLTRHATRIVKQGDSIKAWVAEFFIPFELLKPLRNVPPTKGTRWRANLYRIDYDKGSSEWSWQPVKTNFHDIKNFGTILFD
jgi:hypothetical protein